MNVTVEDIVKLISMIGIPSILGVVWLCTALVSTKGAMHAMTERMERMEKHIHEMRNTLTALLLEKAAKGKHYDDE